MEYSDGNVLEYTWFAQMLLAWDLLVVDWKTYYYLWEEIWSAQKLKNWIVKNREEVSEDLRNRFLDQWFEREKPESSLPF